MTFTLGELIQDLPVILKGDPKQIIKGVATIQQAKSGHLTFLTNAQYRKYLSTTQASAVIIKKDDLIDSLSLHYIITENPHYIYAKIAQFFSKSTLHRAGCHPTAIIDETVKISASAFVGSHCVVGKNVVLGEKVFLNPGCIIGDDCYLDDEVYLDAHVTLYSGIKVGKRTHLRSGCVIGTHGLGYANEKGVWHHVPQLGTVIIGEDVNIGSNAVIDRGAVEDTVIGNGAKIDSLVHVGHNVKIGDHTLIAGCSGIAGSTTIGNHCLIGGACNITGHITINDHVMLTGASAASKSILKPGIYSSSPHGAIPLKKHRKHQAYLNRIEEYVQRIKALEEKLEEITK